MEEINLNKLVGEYFQLSVPPKTGREALHKLLAVKINGLIQTDFHQLIVLLYRVDVSEEKLKYLLKMNRDTDAGQVIAELIVDRLCEKAISKMKYKMPQKDIDEAERW